MDFLNNDLLIPIILLFWLLFLVIYGSFWLNDRVEESNLLTLRLKTGVFGIGSFVIIFFSFLVDRCYKYEFPWTFFPEFLPDIVYWGLLLGVGLSVLIRYLKYTEHKEIFVILSLIVVLVRFVFELSEYYNLIYAITLFVFLMLYASLIIRYLDEMTVQRRFLTWFLTLLIVAASSFVLEWFVRLNEYYFTYLFVLYLLTVWERYFWHLEYKRRTSCSACGGWGQEGIRGKSKQWWAVGYTKWSANTYCKTCGGKGWVHRHEKLLHD